MLHAANTSLIYLPAFRYASHILLCKLCTQIKAAPIVLTMNRQSLQWIWTLTHRANPFKKYMLAEAITISRSSV